MDYVYNILCVVSVYFRATPVLYTSFHTNRSHQIGKTFLLNGIAFLFVIYNNTYFSFLFLPLFKNYWLSYSIQISKWKIKNLFRSFLLGEILSSYTLEEKKKKKVTVLHHYSCKT